MLRLSLMSSLIPASVVAAPNVTTDIAPIQGITAAVMGDLGTPSVLLPPGADPHHFALRPSDAEALTNADLVIWVGEALTPWLTEPISTLAGGAKRLELSETENWPMREVRDIEMVSADDHQNDHEDEHVDHEGDEDHAHDHHDGIDPHGWLDPMIGGIWAIEIAAALSEVDPGHASTYKANALAFEGEMAALEAEMSASLTDLPPILWPHDAYQYVENRFGLTALGLVASYDGEVPGPATVRELKERVSAAGGNACIVLDHTMTDDMADLLSEGTGAKVVRLALLDQFSYVDGLRRLASDLSGCRQS